MPIFACLYFKYRSGFSNIVSKCCCVTAAATVPKIYFLKPCYYTPVNC